MSVPAGIDTSLVVSTTKRKLTYVRPLQDFMQLKGKFMRYRMDPTYADVTPNYHEEIKEFVEMYTDIPGHGYWDRLTEEQQLRFCKFLRFSDDMPTQFNILCDIDNAKIVTVLNDEAHVTVRTSVSVGPNQIESVEEKAVYGQGRCFGGHKKFDEAYQQLVKKEEEAKNSNAKNIRLRNKEAAKREAELAEIEARGEKPQEEIPDTVVAYMQKGTFMQISVRDYLEQVLGIERKKEEELDPETDEQIAGKALEDMTESDFKMVAVKRQAKRKLAETMFNFMSKFELIPHNADIVSSEFVAKGNINRRVNVVKDMYYVMISGIACLEATKVDPDKNNKQTMGGISLTRIDPHANEISDRGEDMSRVLFARREMKVFRMYPGTIMALENEAFAVGTALDPNYAPKPDKYPGVSIPMAASSDGGGMMMGLASSSSDSQDSKHAGGAAEASFLPPIAEPGSLSHEEERERERQRRQAQALFEKECVPRYKLQMMFESPCTYLAIPQRMFHSSLKDLPRDAAEDILLQLHTSHNIVYKQVSRLGEWIRGGKGGAGGGIDLRLDLDDDCYDEEQNFRAAEAAAKAPTLEDIDKEESSRQENEEELPGEEDGGDNESQGTEDYGELAKSIMLGFAKRSTSPSKKAGQSKYQKEKAAAAPLQVSKSLGALSVSDSAGAPTASRSTRGILRVGGSTLSIGRGRNKDSYDILSQGMTLKEPLDGTYGEEHFKIAEKQRDMPPETPVTRLAREMMEQSAQEQILTLEQE